MANIEAFLTPSIPTVATGTPVGIWTILSKLSSPPNFTSFGTTYWWSINGTDGEDWNNETFLFTTQEEEVDIQFISIDGGSNGTLVFSSNPTFCWNLSENASRYHLHISNDSDFTDIVINITDVSDAVYPLYYTQNTTSVSFTLPPSYSLPYYNKIYYTRVNSFNGGS